MGPRLVLLGRLNFGGFLARWNSTSLRVCKSQKDTLGRFRGTVRLDTRRVSGPANETNFALAPGLGMFRPDLMI
jgi:hypothetical protein